MSYGGTLYSPVVLQLARAIEKEFQKMRKRRTQGYMQFFWLTVLVFMMWRPRSSS